MMDENILALTVATSNVHEGVALILNAAVQQYEPGDDHLDGVELALGALLSNDGAAAGQVLARAFLRAGKVDPGRLQYALEHAELAFWNQFAACFPEISMGDIAPATDAALRQAMHTAAMDWLRVNA